MLVMTTMHCHPLKYWTLHGHRAQNPKNELDGPVGLKGFMRKEPVVTHRNANRSQQVHAE